MPKRHPHPSLRHPSEAGRGHPRRLAAFTLIELVVVVIIIAVLAAIAGVAYHQFVGNSRDTAFLASAKSIDKALTARSARDDVAPTALVAARAGQPGGILGYLDVSVPNVTTDAYPNTAAPTALELKSGARATCMTLGTAPGQAATLRRGLCGATTETVVADTASTASSLAAAFASTDKYPTAIDAQALATLGVTLTDGNRVGGYDADGDSFVVCVEHVGAAGTPDAYAVYDSATGKVTNSGRGAGCTGIALDAGDTPVVVPLDIVLADVNPVATKLAAAFTANHRYPTTLDAPTRTALGIVLAGGNGVGGYDADGDSVMFCLEHTNSTGTPDAYAVYDSAAGKVVQSDRKKGCAGIVLDAGDTPIGAVSFSDTFGGSGPLGTTEVGNAPWDYLTGDASQWSRSSGLARSTTSSIASVTMAQTDNDILVGVNGDQSVVYTRIVDANNWYRLRRSSYTERYEGTVCYGPPNYGCGPSGIWYTSRYYTVYLEKSVNGNVTILQSQGASDVPNYMRLTAKGSTLTVKYGSTSATTTTAFSVNDTSLRNGWKVGMSGTVGDIAVSPAP